MNALLAGGIAGLVIGAPVGPVGVLCLKRALTKGPAIGLASGLGAAAADTIITGVAIFGLAFISDLLAQHGLWLQRIGGASMCLLGLRTMLILPHRKDPGGNGLDMAHASFSALFLTLANPGIYLFVIAVLAALRADDSGIGPGASGPLLAGVFAGSLCWGVLIAASALVFHARFTLSAVRRLHGIFGLIIAVFGAGVLSGLNSPSAWPGSPGPGVGRAILIAAWLTAIGLDGVAWYLGRVKE